MIYLDNAASTRVREEVLETVNDILLNDYANPDAAHEFGLQAAKRIKKSRQIIADALSVSTKEVYFTSGGSEGNNIIIQGIINGNPRQGKHLITTKIEHPSIFEIFKEYERNGFEVTYLNVDSDGRIKLDELTDSIRDDTVLISVIAVNSETGVIQDLEKIGNIIKQKNKNVYFHSDFVQGLGHIKINPAKCRLDALTVSSHKVYGPKGAGAIYLSGNVKIKPLIFGSNQEQGVVQRTLNSSGIIGFGKAVQIACENFSKDNAQIKEVKEYLLQKIQNEISDIRVNTIEEDSVPHILNISFRGIQGEVLVHFLGMSKIYVSTGSACSSRKGNSRILESMGLTKEEVAGGIRFSFSVFNTKEEMDETVKVLKEAVAAIRMMK
ncbi:Cysteine desulfurase [Sebaldella termitidis]|uniref:Cysteine desulfurase n=1 Tax=Sebaldella termitidis (strain ATCC 33386 / NCTC 11300) TaxID=526218 RepID=D1AQ07_SEBTE|nr:cysteine desulfurase family protein [Sebaldella termitidis]ACZ07585.1 Cysteine desulfurase [Sebaldella termitidis ATCC 33386]SUI22881.1 Cysteine desulfurase [Sebaldella termitidis]